MALFFPGLAARRFALAGHRDCSMRPVSASREAGILRGSIVHVTPIHRIIVALGVVAATLGWHAAARARDLSFEDRVAAQRAIERVYWSHRIWPRENPAPKPPLSSQVSESDLQRTVEEYLRKSSALEILWGRTVGASELQAEIDRMARD